MLSSDKEQEERWDEHFDEVLNREDQTDLSDTVEEPDHLDLDIKPEPRRK